MQRDEICLAARRIRDYQTINPEKGLRGIFETLDIDEDSLGHIARHALEYTEDLDLGSFAWGVLLGAMVQRERTPTSISDDEFAALLA